MVGFLIQLDLGAYGEELFFFWKIKQLKALKSIRLLVLFWYTQWGQECVSHSPDLLFVPAVICFLSLGLSIQSSRGWLPGKLGWLPARQSGKQTAILLQLAFLCQVCSLSSFFPPVVCLGEEKESPCESHLFAQGFLANSWKSKKELCSGRLLKFSSSKFFTEF